MHQSGFSFVYRPSMTVTAIILLSGTSSWAGTASSGGGNSIVCFSSPEIPAAFNNPHSPRHGEILDADLSSITSIEALDLYESRLPEGLNTQPNPVIDVLPNEGARSYMERVASRFDHYVPAISSLIRSGSENFPDSNIVMQPNGLTRIKDENDPVYFDSTHCVLATMAVQSESGNDVINGKHFLQIDSRLYSHPRHSKLSQAILFLHEALYSEAREVFATDSRDVRKLVRSLISRENVTVIGLNELARSLRIPYGSACFNHEQEDLDCAQFLPAWAEDQSQATRDPLVQAMATIPDTLVPDAVQKYNSWIDQFKPAICSGKTWVGTPTDCKPLARVVPDATGKLPTMGELMNDRGYLYQVSAACEYLGGNRAKECVQSHDDLVKEESDMALQSVRDGAKKSLLNFYESTITPEIEKLTFLTSQQKKQVKSIMMIYVNSVEIDLAGGLFSYTYSLDEADAYLSLQMIDMPIPAN